MRTLQCTVPAAFDGRPLKHLLRGELGISSTLLKTRSNGMRARSCSTAQASM